METLIGITALIAATSQAVLVEQNNLEAAMNFSADAAAFRAAETMGPIDSQANAPLAACRNVRIQVNNQKSVKIKALKVDYRSIQDGRTRTEQFPNQVVSANSLGTVASGQNLQHIKGHTMQWMKLYYKAWCGGKWSVTKISIDSSFSSPQCVAGHTYRIDLLSTNPC